MDSVQCQTVLVHLPNNSVLYDWFKEVHYFYKPIHTYLSIVMCVLGTVANFCNIVVLTRRTMRTPVNMILTAMACCDTVVLFSNLIYTTHYSFVAFKHCHPRHWSYAWALFLIAHAHISLVGHSSSVWLSVMLALIRYMTLRSRGNMGGMQVGLKHSYFAIAGTICFVAIVNAPNFLTYKIEERLLRNTCEIKDKMMWDAPAYYPGIAEIALAQSCFVFRLAFWISGFVFKVIPCCLLSLFVWLLLKILKEVKENRQRLLKTSRHNNNASNATSAARNGKMSLTPAGEKIQRHGSQRGRGERADRTTQMLLAIVFVMLFTEMPQGIMAVLSGLFSEEFRLHVYNNVGDLLDLLSLCGACMSFIIYCSMSGQFRNEFRRVFIPSRADCTKRRSSIRRPSDTYTKMSFLRPTEFNGSICTTSIAESDRATVKVLGNNNARVRRNSTELTRCTADTRVSPMTPMSISPLPNSQETSRLSTTPVPKENSNGFDNGALVAAISNGSVKEKQFLNI